MQVGHLGQKLEAVELDCKLVVAVELGYMLVERQGRVNYSLFAVVTQVDHLMELKDDKLEHYLLDLHLVVALVVANY